MAALAPLAARAQVPDPPAARASGVEADAPPACAAQRPSRARQPVFEQRGPGLCEGFIEKPVGEAFIELVSLTTGSPAADPRPLHFVQRSLPVAQITLQPRAGSPLYRVEATLRSGIEVVWDPAAMLRHTGLALADIGFLVHAAPANSPRARVTPLVLNPAATANTVALIRATVDLASVTWRLYGASAVAEPRWQAWTGAKIHAWTTLPIVLPKVLESPSTLEVAATDDSGLQLPMLIVDILGAAP
jgi:hypothetical protein